MKKIIAVAILALITGCKAYDSLIGHPLHVLHQMHEYHEQHTNAPSANR